MSNNIIDNKHILILRVLTVWAIVMTLWSTQLMFKVDKLDELYNVESPIIVMDTTNIQIINDTIIPDNFNYVHNRFKVYNSLIDTSTTHKFIEVADHYKLYDNTTRLNWLIGQVLLESGAKQYYKKGNKKGKLVMSYAGAIGMTQVMPSTGFYNLTNNLTELDKIEFEKLGSTDFRFIDESKLNKKLKIELCEEWLSNETNNIIMWGYIMNHELSKKSLNDALISYNAGGVGLKRFLASGKSRNDHKYIQGIKKILNRLKKKIV